MPYKDPERRRISQRARSLRCRQKKHFERYGHSEDMRGKGHHLRGEAHYRWNGGRSISSHGYVKVQVGKGHPMADPNGYAYEHDLVLVAKLGRPLLPGEVCHHLNEIKTDNRPENLEPRINTEHCREHTLARHQRNGGLRPGTDPTLDGREHREWPQ